MSSSSSSTRPVTLAPSTSSCMRLRVRRNVDFPQPDGPISACTRLATKPSETFFTAVNLPYIAQSCSVRTRSAAGAEPVAWGGASGSLLRRGVRSAAVSMRSGIGVEAPPDREPRAQAQQEDDEDEHKGRRPGVLMPLFVRTGRVGEDG